MIPLTGSSGQRLDGGMRIVGVLAHIRREEPTSITETT